MKSYVKPTTKLLAVHSEAFLSSSPTPGITIGGDGDGTTDGNGFEFGGRQMWHSVMADEW